MTERLSSADVSFFYLEGRTTPQHVGGLAVFAPPAEGFDYDRLVRLLEERIVLVPRYRQKIRAVPAHLANPVWVDDPNFDITYHVRRSTLPRPGNQAQLLEFCARIQSRLLDRSRPLWELYLVEGLPDGKVAILTKTHHAMVDEAGAIDIGQVILDTSPQPLRTVGPHWMPEPEPSATRLLCEALAGFARRPGALVDAVRLGIKDARASTGQVTSVASTALSTTLAIVRRAPSSPLTVTLGQHRRIAVARSRLEDYRQVRQTHGGTVNDVALATVAGALRGWLVQRGEPVPASLVVRALAPVSVSDDDGADRVTPLLVDLPVGEPSPPQRLALISQAMAEHQRSGRSVSARALVALSGFAPPTLHGLGARAAKGLTRRMFSLVVTNVPGPQHALYAAGARMTEMFPIPPLGPGQAVSIGITSYDGDVFYGVNSDRDAMPDVAVLATLIEQSLADLVAASPVAGERTGVARRGQVGRGKPVIRRVAAATAGAARGARS
ncbi:MAG: wax ester/triacylglycerol synthase family O-acyltransferase [Pseudonocardiales bacterium]|nr:wax ester/triacylglycerol synthase family O-acyltransferase [Actinomycetota bacterium]